jgi:hypothetical protein
VAVLEAGITPSDRWVKKLRKADDLLGRIKARLPLLEEWLAEIKGPYEEEDGIYRFYHQSFKVFGRLQPHTESGFKLISEIGSPVNEWYQQIYQDGVRKETPEDMNEHWLKYARPILEAFWHTKYFIEMMVKYGRQLEFAPVSLPLGWAAIQALFGCR